MKNTVLIIVGILLTVVSGSAQVSVGGEPYSWDLKLSITDVPIVQTDSLDFSLIAYQDSLDSVAGEPPRFGIPDSVDINLSNSGNWIWYGKCIWLGRPDPVVWQP